MGYVDPVLDMKVLRDINAGREVFYNFLSRSYQAEVDDEYLEMLVSLMPYIENITSQAEVETLKTGGKLLTEFVNRLNGLNTEAKEELLLDLARDFAYLFLTGVKSVPTCGSVYLSPEHLVKQEPYARVLRMYRAIGFQVPRDFKEPEDHIAMQLKFMAVLSQLIGGAIDAKDAENARRLLGFQQRFLKEHLNKWVPLFCHLLIRAAEGRDFYQAIGYLTEGFLSMDYEFMRHEMLPVGG